MPLLVDTGVIYALADRSDAWHAKVSAFVVANRATLLAPVTILPEVAYLLRERLGPTAEYAFVDSIARGEIAVENLKGPDWTRIRQVVQTYDQLGFVDASIVAIAERLKVTDVATTDRRHFSTVKPAHTMRFRLVP